MSLQTVIHDNYLTPVGLRLALRRVAATVSPETQLGKSNVGLTSCLMDCAESIHQDNRKRGWWTDLKTGEPLQRNAGELLMLMVSEIAEIPAEGVMSVLDDKLPERLMFEVELADCAIRIFDTMGALAPLAWKGYLDGCTKIISAHSQSDYCMTIVRHLANAMEARRKNWFITIGAEGVPGFDYWLGRALHAVFYTSSVYSLAIAEAISEKLDFNRKREDHSLEHRRAEGGKQF
jgi:hypothetical protein